MTSTRRHLVIAAIFGACTFPIVAYQKHHAAAAIKNLPPGENVLWTDPGDVASLDLLNGVGGQEMIPQGPFQFVEEDMAGTNPKVKVKDSKGRSWSVKFGDESKPSVFSTRIVWACGYVAETEYLVTHGQINGAKHLKRAGSYIQDGTFTDARFQLRSDSPKYLDQFNWAWNSNPFLGNPQLNGLKILVMLLSNWDTKDARDRDTSAHSDLADSNLGIFQDAGQNGPRYLYLVTDWGASLGRWGSAPGPRNKWSCKDYASQTPGFVRGVDNGAVRFAYAGKHNDDITQGIRVSDVQWLMQYLGRITDNQLRRGLAGCGASPEQIDCYTHSIRQRIDQLAAAAK